ncbi:hypothetical protein QYE76_010961 [Lolium multiflorum]|uniref:Uncharacterized protein n=1 Tax=Lolium multiflorum TaxID=4521 RepID=A0AAD8X563_LOLMU|nr:hypothetical protein QYE76_010961 [Lolium multiflorum]
MATALSVRSGGPLRRRLLSYPSIAVAASEAATAACHGQIRPLASLSGATPPTARTRTSSLPYKPRVDMLSMNASSTTSSPLRGAALHHSQVDTLRATASSTTSSPGAALHPSQMEILRATASSTTSSPGAALHPSQIEMLSATASSTTSSSLHGAAIHPSQVETPACDTSRGHARPVASRPTIAILLARPVDLQRYAGAPTYFRRQMSSAGSPSPSDPSLGKEIPPAPSGQLPQSPDDEKSEVVCKYNEQTVLSALDKISEKVETVDTKVEGVTGDVSAMKTQLQKSIEDCAQLAKDVAQIKKREEGSGDWTAFRIRGKNLNWLSVGSAVWELLKGLFK